MSGRQPNSNLAAQLAEARAMRASFQASGSFRVGNESSRGQRGVRDTRNRVDAWNHAEDRHRGAMAGSTSTTPGRFAGAEFMPAHPVSHRPTQEYYAPPRLRAERPQIQQYTGDDFVENFFNNTSPSPARGQVIYYDEDGRGDVNTAQNHGGARISTTHEYPQHLHPNREVSDVNESQKASKRSHLMPEISDDPVVRAFFDGDDDTTARGTVQYYQDNDATALDPASNAPAHSRQGNQGFSHVSSNSNFQASGALQATDSLTVTNNSSGGPKIFDYQDDVPQVGKHVKECGAQQTSVVSKRTGSISHFNMASTTGKVGNRDANSMDLELPGSQAISSDSLFPRYQKCTCLGNAGEGINFGGAWMNLQSVQGATLYPVHSRPVDGERALGGSQGQRSPGTAIFSGLQGHRS